MKLSEFIKELDEIMEFNLFGSISYRELRNRLSEVDEL